MARTPSESVLMERFKTLHKESLEDLEGFWASVARELNWFKSWDILFDDSEPPFYRWFVGGKINISYNCLDRNLERGLGNKAALIWEGEEREQRVLTYRDLYREVNRVADALLGLGIRQGDRVIVYMPMIPEAAITLLAVARLGAIHSVVFSGFGAQALAERIIDSGAKLIITADAALRRGSPIPLKSVVDSALTRCDGTQRVVVVKHADEEVTMREGRDIWWHEMLERTRPRPYVAPHESDSQSPLFILYTSGTTGRPKGVVHAVGPYTVWAYIHLKWLFGFEREDDVFFSTPDIGWINGHSYSLYGPLLNGATVLWYEGAPDYPRPDRWWEIVERHQVNYIWLAPTAVRHLMRLGDDWVRGHDLSSLKLIVSAGEILGHEAWRWLYEVVGQRRCHVIETWGQTENSGFIASPGGLGVGGIFYREGSVGMPLPGIDLDVYTDEGRPAGAGIKGHVVVKSSAPCFMTSIWGDVERYKKYWERFGVYYTGDYGFKDEEGFLYILGRVDDVIKVAGHRLSTYELENSVMKHPAVAEAAVVGKPDPVRGEVIAVFVSLKQGFSDSKALREEIKQFLRNEFGHVAVVSDLFVVDKMPKTRTGKIMRRVLRAQITGEDLGDVTTLEDAEALEHLRRAVRG